MIMDQTADKVLVDYNYNVEFVMSSSSSQRVAQPLLVLELILKVNQDEYKQINSAAGKTLQRVIIEMNQQEAADFVAKLNKI